VGWVVNTTSQPPYLLGGASVPIVQEAWRPPSPVWTAADNRKPLAPTAFRTPECPARSELLYPMRFPGPLSHLNAWKLFSSAFPQPMHSQKHVNCNQQTSMILDLRVCSFLAKSCGLTNADQRVLRFVRISRVCTGGGVWPVMSTLATVCNVLFLSRYLKCVKIFLLCVRFQRWVRDSMWHIR
jgi:hypothetical protein